MNQLRVKVLDKLSHTFISMDKPSSHSWLLGFWKKLSFKLKELLKKRHNLDERISNPLSIEDINNRKLIKEMVEIEEILASREKEFHIHSEQVDVKNFLENNHLTRELLYKASQLLHLWDPTQPCFGMITFDYAHNIISAQNEKFSPDLYFSASQLEKAYRRFRYTLNRYKKELVNSCWSVCPIKVISILHEVMEELVNKYQNFSENFRKEVKNSIPTPSRPS